MTMSGGWEELGTCKWPPEPRVQVVPEPRSDEREEAPPGRSTGLSGQHLDPRAPMLRC